MKEYQICVSQAGRFLFRTEWDDNKERIFLAANIMFGMERGTTLEVVCRDKTMMLESLSKD